MLIYDCEIVNAILGKGGTPIPGITYCDGWDDFWGMGLACVGFGYDNGSLGFWRSDQLGVKDLKKAIQGYSDRGELAGFNSKKFDDRLLGASGIEVRTAYDVLEEIRIAAYGSPQWEDQPEGYTYGLNAIAKANGLGEKSGRGDLAPIWWQQGDRDRVVQYCLRDVKLTREVLKLGLAGRLIDPNTGKRLRLRAI